MLDKELGMDRSFFLASYRPSTYFVTAASLKSTMADMTSKRCPEFYSLGQALSYSVN